MPDLVIEVSGGVVQEVFCDDPNIRVVLVDWDELRPPEPAATAGRLWNPCAALCDLSAETRAQFQQALAAKHP